ncbi:24233_t:CDS:2, partial [Racocetra persica]
MDTPEEESDSSDEYRLEEEEEEEILPDWMILKETDFSIQICNSSDLDMSTFIQRAYEENVEDHRINNSANSIFDYRTLNDKQKLILDRIE